MYKMTIMRFSTLVFTLLIVFSIVGTLIEETKAADPATSVTLAPSMQIIAKIGDAFTETVAISTSEQVNSINFTVSFNASLLSVVSVYQSSFFPQQFPPTHFAFVTNLIAGTINISVELLDAQTRTGNGSLATITFMATMDPQSEASSTIGLDQVLIRNAAHESIACDTMNAMWFWRHAEPPPPPPPPRVIDVYTQKGGTGPNAYGGEFTPGSLVMLSAYATYNNFPVQSIGVAFQILDAKNQTIAILVGTTDENGIATVQFRIRLYESAEGTWWAVASGDVSSTIVWDTVTFKIVLPQIVGGYTVSRSQRSDLTTLYLTAIVTLTVAFVVTKHGFRKK